MTDITAIKLNDVFTHIVCDNDIREELRDYFTFETPENRFDPRIRKKQWDGKLRLFDKRNNNLYTGLLRYLEVFAKERNYTIEFDKQLNMMNSFSVKEAADYITKLNIYSKGKPLIPREYQIMGLAKAIRYKRMMMISPTSSGKSYIMYCITRWLLEHGEGTRGLLIVPNTALVEQMYGDFEDYSSHNGWSVENHVQKLYFGFSSHLLPQTQLLISTWQSIYDSDREWFSGFDFVLGDEAHGFKAKCLSQIMRALPNCPYRIGTTGTDHDTDAEAYNISIEGHFGPRSKLTTTRAMQDAGECANLRIKSIVFKHPAFASRLIKEKSKQVRLKMPTLNEGQAKYLAEINYIITNRARNEFIKNLALSLKKNTLILFNFVEKHGRVLYDMINEELKNDPTRKLFFVHGGVDTDARDEIRYITEKEENAIIVASFGVFSTGVNIKNLHNLIFANPTKAKIRTLQSIGRILRLAAGKEFATLFDIADDFRTENEISSTNYTLKQYAKRMIIYYNEKHNVSHYNVNLNYTLTKI